MVKQALACLLVVCCFCSAASASTVVWPDTKDLVYFYSPACDLCDDAALLLSNLESESNITILRYDLTEVESLALMKTLLEEKNLEPELAGAAPAVFSQQGYIIGPFDEDELNRLVAGESLTEQNLRRTNMGIFLAGAVGGDI